MKIHRIVKLLSQTSKRLNIKRFFTIRKGTSTKCETDRSKTYEIPCAAEYVIDNCKISLELEEELAKKCLRDPWIRNEVWRYDERQFGTERQRLIKLLLRGFIPGLIAAVITTIYTKMSEKKHKEQH